MSRVVVYDACVLFPATLRDLMLRLAVPRGPVALPRRSERQLGEVGQQGRRRG